MVEAKANHGAGKTNPSRDYPNVAISSGTIPRERRNASEEENIPGNERGLGRNPRDRRDITVIRGPR